MAIITNRTSGTNRGTLGGLGKTGNTGKLQSVLQKASSANNTSNQGFNQGALNAMKTLYGKTGTSVLGNNKQLGDTNYTPVSYSNVGYDSGSNYYNDLWNSFQKQSEAARDAAINAIMKNLESVRSAYQGQIETVGNDFDRQIDENELRKERARRVTRENQANRGQLESGLGRQELLNQNVGYDKITSNLKSDRAKAINDIYNLITQAEAEAESGKANIHNNYANSLLQYRLANM